MQVSVCPCYCLPVGGATEPLDNLCTWTVVNVQVHLLFLLLIFGVLTQHKYCSDQVSVLIS